MASNPYLQQQANDISTNLTQNWQTSQLPSINMGAIATGGYGGSRQGIAQGLGLQGLNQSIGQAQTNLYSNAYNTDQQLQAQKDMQASSLAAQQQMAQMTDATNRLGLSNNYNLGIGNLGLGATTANQNFYTNQRAQDLSAASLGSSLASAGNTGLANQGSQLYQTGQTQQQAPVTALQNYSNLLSPYTGLNQTTTNSTPGASTTGSALGGALTAAQIWSLLSGG